MGEFSYARFGPAEVPVHACSRRDVTGKILTFDLVGEFRTPLLRDRLLALESDARFDHVLLRGVSPFLRAEIADAEGRQELLERFPGSRIWVVDATERPVLLPADGGALASEASSAQLLAGCAQAELEAVLVWHNAVWHDPSYHFVVPSGHHSDKFVRVGDVFADPLNVTRVADWCAHLVTPGCVLVADSFTLLPLLQELELRWWRRAAANGSVTLAMPTSTDVVAGEISKYVVPLYGAPEDVVRERLAEVVPIARERGGAVVALVSVSASGGYVAALNAGLARFVQPPPLRVLALCATDAQTTTGPERTVPRREADAALDDSPPPIAGTTTAALCRIPTRRYVDRASCMLCRDENSTPIEIDQQRFTTRLGVRMLDMPKARAIEESTLVIREADPCGAFRVHVERPDHHGHLAIHVDTARVLQSRVFRAKATLGLATVRTAFVPDLVLVPRHDATPALSEWLSTEELSPIEEIALDAALPLGLEDKIRAARRILLADDAVITGRTLHALIEHVQRVKGQAEESAYDLRGFVLVARPPASSIWKRLQDRFFIRGQHGLAAAWVVYLPDVGTNGREACPWCAELRWLNNALPTLSDAARAYAERRVARLRDPGGLDRGIYLGAEGALDTALSHGWDPAVHTTPGSYLGNVNDVGAYVGAAALLQSMRDTWNANPERWSMRYAMPLATALGRYTDPVIVAGLLRGVTAAEVWSSEVDAELPRALQSLHHGAAHGVLAAEILLAARQRKLPRGAATDIFRERLENLPDEIRLGLTALLNPDPVGAAS